LYNQQRRHSSIGYRTPAEHERCFHDQQLGAAA
jgi:transposase InsO family protein